jgi:Skp family chaperone for outer membrane proteins
MKHTILSAAVTAILAVPASAMAATDADFEQVRRTLEQMNQRLDQLEARNKELEAKNARLEAKNQELEESNEKQTDMIVQSRTRATSTDWASKLSWKGDFRYRHESVEPEEAVNDQTRHRIRARFGLTAKVTDTISTTVQLATNGGNNDPRSTNQTIGSGFDRKGVAIDLAYVDWKAADGMNVQLGKLPLPFVRAGSYFWDNDITPEGGAFKLARGPFFANVYGFWLQEASTTSDANVVGAQLGIKQPLGPVTLTGAAHYYDVGAVEGEITTTAGPCTANNAFFGGPQGNTTVTQGGCARLLNDYEILEVLLQADMKLGSLPFSVFAQASQNDGAVNDLDQAWAAGFSIGRASDPMTWDVGLAYQKTEKDALFGQFVDSDFGGGVTDVEGAVLKVGFAPMRNVVINGTYFANDRFVDVGTERSYDRWQLDTSVRF